MMKHIRMVIAYLRRRWRFTPRRIGPDPKRVTYHKEFPLGTRYQRCMTSRRYACAGENLKPGTLCKADLAGRLAPPPAPSTMQITADLIWGNVKAATEVDVGCGLVLGWPEIKVKERQHFWLVEPPLGAKFKKEENHDMGQNLA